MSWFLLGLLVSSRHKLGEHHQPLRGRANVVGRVTGNQSQLRVGRWLDHAYIIRLYDRFAGNLKTEKLAAAKNSDLITLIQLKNVTKKGVAVGRDDCIAGLARDPRLLYVSRALGELLAGHSFQRARY